MYKAIKTDAVTLEPKIIEVDFEIKGKYIYVIKGGSTGYESADIKSLVKTYLEKSVFTCWTACMGTLNSWNNLKIPMSEIIKYLIDNNYIKIEKEYGYIKTVEWLKELGD